MEMEAVYKVVDDRSLCIKYKTIVAMEEALQRNLGSIKSNYTNDK